MGWKIGEGVVKHVRIGMPAAADTTVTGQRVRFKVAGEALYGGVHRMPYDGWVWTFDTPAYSGLNTWFDYSSPGADKCNKFIVTPPTGWGEILRTENVNTCYRGYYENPQTAPVHGLSAIAREDALTAVGPIEDYSGQPFGFNTPWWPDKPTTRTQLETRTQTALESGSYPLLSRWYAHQLDPQNYPDPTTTTQFDHRCDRGQPTYKNPDGNTAPPPLAPKDLVPYQATGRPSQALGEPDPYLRWGTTSWGGDYLDNWPGWGWRHIRAKHGWSEGPSPTTDEGATRAVLAAPVATVDEGTSMRYVGPQVERNGVLCTRVVVVEYEPKPGDTDPYGIITSFERFDGEAG